MDIKSLWDKFLELRKSPACIIFSIIGLLDIFVFIYLYLFMFTFFPITDCLYFLSRAYVSIIVCDFPYYISVLIGLFIIEKIFKFNLKNNFIENNKIYNRLWVMGIFAAILCYLSIPIILYYFKLNGWE